MQIFSLLLLGVLYVNSTEAGKLSLEDYLLEVKSSNPSIEASKLRSLALKHRIEPARTLEDPFIAAGIDEAPFEGGGPELRRYQLSQTIPFPGKLSTRGDIAEKRAKSVEYDAETLTRQIKVFATQVYLNAVYNRESMKLNQRIQTVLMEISSSAKSRYRSGDNAHHEWLLAKVELSTVKVDFIRLQRSQSVLMALMNELRNRPPHTPIELEDARIEDLRLAENLSPDIASQPEIKAIEAIKNVANDELKLARLSYAPDFVIQGMAMEPTSQNMSGMKSNWGLMVGVTVPLYFWRKQSELIAAAEKDFTATVLEHRSLANRLNTELTNAKEEHKTSLDVVKLYEKDVLPVTEIAVKNARASYSAKTLPLRQFLDVLRTQKIQELEYLAAKIDVQLTALRIRELLSSPPLLKLAPSRPTFFGINMSSSMGSSNEMGGSASINMGGGMSGPTRMQSPAPEESSVSGMEGM